MKNKGVLPEGSSIEKNEELFKKTKITEIVSKIEYDGKHFLTIGKYRITEMKDTEEILEEWMTKNIIELICSISTVVTLIAIEKK